MGWLDKPNWRKVNKKPMPLVGGLAIYLGFIVACALVLPKSPVAVNNEKLLGFLAGSFIILLVGITDDIKGLSARRKLFYQMAAALLAYISGYSIIKVSNILGGAFHAPAIISMTLTVIWIIGFTNAINLMDGLDGLAAGVSAIIAASLFFAGIRSNNIIVSLLAIGIAGSTLGFLPYNFYPAKIFMGDTGSMFLGFALSLISIEAAHKGATFVTLLIPIIAMGVPTVDTGLSIIRRLIKGNGVFKADKEHIHHKLLVREGAQRPAVITLYLLTGSFGLIAIALSRMTGIWAAFAIIITAILTLRWIFNAGFLDIPQNQKKENNG
jgi:UDP-GlcNAc:undecaprenyl-phosphate GlcNAc-1-phosphate transferase